jgi:MYXO-CTERM domain-containing protein
VTTAAPTGVTNDSAVLNGSAVPNGNASIGWFRYATVGPGACDDAFGTRTPSSGGTALGAGTQPAAFTAALTGLTRGAAYYYCAIAGNAEGTSFGAIQVAVPGTTSPVVTTEAAVAISGSGATLAGTANPNGNSATGWFRYGDIAPISCDDSFGTRAPVTGGTSLGAGMSPLPLEQPIAGLEPNLTYYYCAAASNLGGATFGEVQSFITDPMPPVVATLTATVGANGAITLEGLANPRGTETTTWFRFSTAAPGSCDDTFGTRWPEVGGTAVGAGRANIHYSEVTELPPGKYFACAIGSNAAGPGFGDLVTFTIPQPSSSGGGGCGCRTGSHSGSDATPVLALIALLLFSSTRRMRNRAKRSGGASCCEAKS